MSRSRENSATATRKDAGVSASQCLFDLDSWQDPHSAERSANVLLKRQVIARPKALATYASDALSLFVDETPSSAKPVQDDAGAAAPLDSSVHVPRVLVVRIRRQRISGAQRITTAVETVCRSAYAVWTELRQHAYQQTETTAEGVEVQHLLSSVGRSELIRLTGLDRKTVRLAIRKLKERYLLALHVPSDPYQHKREVYRLYDPCAAAERMRVEDGIAEWRQRGRGRVVL